ncbi:hypothetical protein BTVI_81200 [Pitangus sulphuratus]|nr:hypothetical protein BTVI_81200 [Pitangus sulphuratus]
MNAILQVDSDQSRVEGENHLPRPAGHTFDVTEHMFCFLGCMVQVMDNQKGNKLIELKSSWLIHHVLPGDWQHKYLRDVLTDNIFANDLEEISECMLIRFKDGTNFEVEDQLTYSRMGTPPRGT